MKDWVPAGHLAHFVSDVVESLDLRSITDVYEREEAEAKDNVEAVTALGTEVFMPPDRQEHGKTIPAAPRGRTLKSLSGADLMRRKLRTKTGRTVYAKRKETVEPVFGQIKQGRGFRQFLLRGLEKVKGEWALICTTHNLLKLWRSTGMGPAAGFAAI